ncbi:hypothetical protein T11_14753 [Trichinella zimbabwensis]|uniref:Uncharacterized protein n=1 Tax=Trichinella zimbabwensis TaxID=268475 RepID=A0A0V1GMR9_9BILA|nr:hypothetical protein T11_4934 [Trichinella zimbabwensis]KRY99623.1 hypothetical protein T11_14753 [Trichinella zimbabwensis]
MNSIILREIIVLREIEHIQGIRYDAQASWLRFKRVPYGLLSCVLR